jgi:diadenylate cyclase
MPPFLDNLLTVIRWRDVFDILLNSYILFRLYIILRGTRLFRIVIFIFLLFLLHQFTATSGMIITHTVMQGVAALTAIGVLIVFRYEIRSIFQSKGMKDIFWRITPKPAQTPIEIIAESVFRLARQNKGALIVLPARQAVDDLIHGGITLNGRVSREIIESIFWPGNPVHDGAVVIDGEKIVRVAAILPLTNSDDLPSRYGTRHRAAIGLTELSDAVVLIVSEERGEVSVAFGGRIHTLTTRVGLERWLHDHTVFKTPSIQNPFNEKLAAGLAAALSLIIISSIWFSYSVGIVISLANVEVPVEYIKRDSQMNIIETSSSTVKLQLSGPRQLISNLNPNQVKVRFDLTDAVAGKNSFNISKKDIVLPPGASVKKIEPSTIDFILDVPGEKSLPVQVDWVGTLSKSVLIQDVKVVPDRIVVKGAQMMLDTIDTLYTQTVSVDNLVRSDDLSVPLTMSPTNLKLAENQPNKIHVYFTVTPRIKF